MLAKLKFDSWKETDDLEKKQIQTEKESKQKKKGKKVLGKDHGKIIIKKEKRKK